MRENRAYLAGNQGECVNDGYLLWFYVCSLDVGSTYF